METTLSKILSLFLSICLFCLELFSSILGGGSGDGGDTGGDTPPATPPTSTPPVVSPVDPDTTSEGVFVFTVYGYGHGVGMSQDGAIQMARNGKTYVEILTHYYPGTTVKNDPSTPATVKYGNQDIPLVEYLCRSTKPEIGAGSPTEAIKAQIVNLYSFAKSYNFNVPASQHAYDYNYSYVGTTVYNACLSVLGMSSATSTPIAKYVDYNGTAARTTCFANSAGKTTSASSVWGGNYPYLCGGVSSPETVTITTVQITSEQMKQYILSYDSSIVLGSDPATWLTIVSHDKAVSDSIGYVANIKVGNKTVRGNAFRCNVLDFAIKSHCFKMEYIPA